MNSALYFISAILRISQFGWLMLMLTAVHWGNAQSCSSCAKVEMPGKILNGGVLSGGPPNSGWQPQNGSTKTCTFSPLLGTRYNMKFDPSSSYCDKTSMEISTCGATLFYKSPNDPGWSIGSRVTMSAESYSACPPSAPTTCAECDGQGTCTCTCCYSEGTEGTEGYDAIYYTAYLRKTVNPSAVQTIDTLDPNIDVFAKMTEYTSNPRFWYIVNPQARILVFQFWMLESVPWDQQTLGDPPSGAPTYSEAWDESAKKTVWVPPTGGSPPTFCTCGPGLPDTRPSKSSEMALIYWFKSTEKRNDPGQGAPQGPGSTPPGGNPTPSPSPGGSTPPPTPVPVETSITFGLGRTVSGDSPAMLRFSTGLDASDPLNPNNFELLDPFSDPASPAFVTTGNPVAGIELRYTGNGMVIDRARTGDTVTLTFRDPSKAAAEQIFAVHSLQSVPRAGSNDPGLIYTMAKDGITQVWEFYGSVDGTGGRTWKNVDPEGNITEGLEQPYGQDQTRLEQLITKKRIGVTETVISDSIRVFKNYPWGEELVSSVVGANGTTESTAYSFYTDNSTASFGKLMWRLNPDGSWAKYEYHPTTGELQRTLRPWLSHVTHPDQATLANSVVTTNVKVNANESWEIESIQGKVTARTWTRLKRDGIDPLSIATDWAWYMPRWKAVLSATPPDLSGDQFTPGSGLRLSIANLTGVGGGRLVRSVDQHEDRLSLTLQALIGDQVFVGPAPQDWVVRREAAPVPFQIETALPRPATPAEMTITCGEPSVVWVPFDDGLGTPNLGTYSPAYISISVNGVSVIPGYEPAVGLTSAEVTEALRVQLAAVQGITVQKVMNPDDPNHPGSLVITTVVTGALASIEVSGLLGGTFSTVPEDNSTGADAGENVTVLATGTWLPGPTPPGPTGFASSLNLNAFNGAFDITKTQTFTADYNFWQGSLRLTDASSLDLGRGDLRRSVDTEGNVTLYSYDRGTFDSRTGVFDWTATGQALKTTTRRYAADPSTFVLLEEDPVFEVTMEDYQGLTRKEQVWKGTDRVSETIHDYDPATRDRIASTTGGHTSFSAVRDEAARTLTQTQAEGTITVTTYTEDGSVMNTAKKGNGARPDLVSTSVESGLTSTETTAAGALTRSSSSTRDALGRVVSTTDENGLTTSYVYTQGGRIVTETLPGGGTRITERYLDGRTKSFTGTAVVPEFHTYAVDAEGNLTETVYMNDSGSGNQRSPRWRSTTTNGLGWLIREESPAPGGTGTLASVHHYNTKGQRIRTQRPGQKDLLFAYDAFGRESAQGVDINSNGQLDLALHEPITASATDYVQQSGLWWERTITTQTVSESATASSARATVSMRLLGNAVHSAEIQATSEGLVTTSITRRNPAAQTVTTQVTTNRSSHTATQTVVNGLLTSRTGLDGATATLFDYDDLERLTVVTEPSGIKRRQVYDDPTTGPVRDRILREEIQPVGATAFLTEKSYAYYPSGAGIGRVSAITDASSNTTSYTYDLQGRTVFTSGTAAYPVRYVYDDYGDLWKMHTYRTGTPTATTDGDVTTWVRDPATGALTQKQDAAASGATYGYEPNTGRLLTRTWARTVSGAPLKATYTYDDAGRLWKIDYSDATPDVTYTYHADGQLNTTQDAAGLHTYTNGGPNRSLSGETISGTGLLSGASWSSTFDTEDRRDGFTWTWGSHTRTTGYGYDGADRLETVTAFGQTATYAYEATTGRLDTLTYTGAALKGDWDHDAHGRLDQVSWKVGLDTRSLHDYGYDSMNRRKTALRENGETWHYDYNGRGEVIDAVKRTGIATTSPAKTGLRSGFGYDGIGNRITDAEHTPESWNGLTEVAWTANALNQITEREVPNSRWVLGHAKAAAQLSADGASGVIERAGDEFAVPVHRTIRRGTATAADWHELKVTATAPGAGRLVNGVAQDVTMKESARLWFAATPEAMSYDADGNLTQDGRWSYEWDAENRLRAMETTPAAVTAGVPHERLEFAYDAQGRRVQKVVKLYSLTAGGFVTLHDTRFLYDGWNLMAEFDFSPSLPVSSSPHLLRSYAWGRDLSGTMEGAGGVGGLLFAQQSSSTVNNSQPPQTSLQAPCYDGNGNITAYVDVASGSVISKHDYDAFGRPVWTELGNGIARVPFGFSTKYEDAETGLLYYGYRYYSPELGRWLKRDPINEKGGANLYAMNNNDSVNSWDYLGLLRANPMRVLKALHKSSGAVSAASLFMPGGWIEWFEDFQFQTYQAEHQAPGLPGVYEMIESGNIFSPDFNGVPLNPTEIQLESLEMSVISTLDLPVTPAIYKLKACSTDPSTSCEFYWEGVDRGGYPPHTNYLKKHFSPAWGVVVRTPDGDWAGYDSGRVAGQTPTQVFELKTGRAWSSMPMNLWSRLMHKIYASDSAQFARQRRVAMKCKLKYQIWMDNEDGYRGYRNKSGGSEVRYVP